MSAEVLKRLESLYRHADEEGWHVHANTVFLAIQEINETHRAAKALLNNLWIGIVSADKSHDENWTEFERRFPGVKWLHEALSTLSPPEEGLLIKAWADKWDHAVSRAERAETALAEASARADRMSNDWGEFCELMGVNFDTQEAVAYSINAKINNLEAALRASQPLLTQQ